MGNSKKKILVIGMIGILLIGASVYFMGSGSFLQGKLSRNLTEQKPRNTTPELPRKITTPDTPRTVITPTPQAKPEPAPAPDKPATPPAEEAPAEPDTPAPAPEPAPAPDKPATPPAEEAPAEPLPVIFDTATFNVTAVMEAEKNGTFNLVSKYSVLRYGQNSAKDSYRISVDFPTYEGDDKNDSYEVPIFAVICKQKDVGTACATAHTETVTIHKNPEYSWEKSNYYTITRDELYNAVQTLGANHGEKVDFKMQIEDPNGEILTSTGAFKQKIEDDALKLAFNLTNFKLTKGEYVPAADGPFIQFSYTQTGAKTNEYGTEYFYTGDQDSFKFFIEVCDASDTTVCANYLETQSTGVASIGGTWPIPISELQTFTDGVGFTSGTKLLFKLAVQDNVEGAEKYYAKGFYLYILP
ncbi:hypothetical protein HY604_02445 [Candidatus Peregrinibacteria bacterium]|nr:hypothetical protein [Candidatus Peregrinibacteria bacterium]